MRKSIIIRSCLFLLIFSFMMFYSPNFLVSKASNKGDLIGFIYGKDGTTPLGSGIVKIKNISTSTVYESTKSDELGLFRIEDIEGGLYTATISSKKGNFIAKNLIGIKTNETAKVSFALEIKGGYEEEMQPVSNAIVIASSAPIMYNFLELMTGLIGYIQGDEEGEDKGNEKGRDTNKNRVKANDTENTLSQSAPKKSKKSKKSKKPKKPKKPKKLGKIK